MKYLVLVVALLFNTPCFADDAPFTLGIGPVRENDGVGYKVLTATYEFMPHLQVITGGIVKGSYTTAKSDYHVAWGGVQFIESEQWLYGGVGLVKLSRKTEHLTSPYQFYLTFGVHYDPFILSYDHLSNGNTGGANYGEDMIVLAIEF